MSLKEPLCEQGLIAFRLRAENFSTSSLLFWASSDKLENAAHALSARLWRRRCEPGTNFGGTKVQSDGDLTIRLSYHPAHLKSFLSFSAPFHTPVRKTNIQELTRSVACVPLHKPYTIGRSAHCLPPLNESPPQINLPFHLMLGHFFNPTAVWSIRRRACRRLPELRLVCHRFESESRRYP